MLLIAEKVARGKFCHAIHQYVKPNNKNMNDYDKTKESLFLISIGMKIIYMNGKCCKGYL